MLYVRRNEHTNRIKVVTVVEKAGEVLPKLEEDLKFLDAAYPEIDIEFVAIEGIFRPALIQELSAKWGIPASFMFIGFTGRSFSLRTGGTGRRPAHHLKS